jgi:hypothetical protein
MVEISHYAALIAPLSICVLLSVLTALSRRLGMVTQAPPYYRGFYLANVLVMAGLLIRLWNLLQNTPVDLSQDQNWVWIVIYNGLPAFGVTLGLAVAWRYWSWLLAERD